MPTYTSLSLAARFRSRRSRPLVGLGYRVAVVLTCVASAVTPLCSAGAQSVIPATAGARVPEPTSYDELWRAAMVAVDDGEFETNATTRAALFAKATAYARRAVALNPGDAEGHFHLARALGRTALSLGPRDRVKYGIEVREHAMHALRVAPRHAGALHVMGVWNAEIMRLSGFSRAVAKTFLGGQIFNTASWPEAVRYMELAVQIEPDRLVHRLDVARIYRDIGRADDARASYRAALNCANMDANDTRYRQQAGDELRRMR
jgi:tetratricopeptide (TPR) repeat protein